MHRRLAILALLLLTSAPAMAQTTDAILDSVQHRAFGYFWSEANPANGLVRDRSQSGSPASIAAVGFGLSSICVGIDHGWVSRSDGAARVLTTLQTFWNGPQGSGASGFIGYKGLFYHFLDMNTGARTWTSELSTIDTALLMAGVLDAREYFTTQDSAEVQIRALADSIDLRVDWNFMRNLGSGIRMGWTPETAFGGFGTWTGYNEAMIMYILALGSPTHPVPVNSWNTWTSGYVVTNTYGYSFINCPPLFTHQYSHCWVDFRSIWDTYTHNLNMTYFENSRRATLAQRNYCIANPGHFSGYSDSLWGLTACDGPAPTGYNARGAPPAQGDDGTIAPTAATSSIAFTPEVSIPAIRNMYTAYHAPLWSTYGFRDAFNPGQNWYDSDFLGIDQGPIVLMIENYHNGSVWHRAMNNLHILTGLSRAGFTSLPTGVGPGHAGAGCSLSAFSPNPFRSSANLKYSIAGAGRVRISAYDASGRRLANLVDAWMEPGEHSVAMDGRAWPAGLVNVRMECNGVVKTQKGVRVR